MVAHLLHVCDQLGGWRLLAKDEALAYFVNYFLTIKEVAEPLIDG